jgi:hypothetical protein
MWIFAGIRHVKIPREADILTLFTEHYIQSQGQSSWHFLVTQVQTGG